jgi:ABC-2 type transport system permease protein
MTGAAQREGASPGVADGHVYRRDYERYTGVREGRRRAYLSVVAHSVRRALGIRRKWTSKVVPALLYVSAFLPVIGFIAVRAMFGIDLIVFTAADLFAALSLILLIFAAAAAPEMLCDDRRERVLQLYYSRGLTAGDYLIAKLIALGTLMLTISLIPALILFLGDGLLADSPVRHLASNAGEALRIVMTATLLSVFYAAIGLAISAVTLRKGIASAIYVGLFLVATPILVGVFEAVEADWARYLVLITPLEAPGGLIALVMGTDPDPGSMVARADVSHWWYLASLAGIVLASAGILYRRYLKEDSA